VKPTEMNGLAERHGKRVSVALPIRVIYEGGGLKPQVEMACTYDISAHGACISALRNLKHAGEIVTVERGRSKAMCRVAWVGKEGPQGRRQIGLECVNPEETLWDLELRGLEHAYDAIETKSPAPKKSVFGQRSTKRRDPRYTVEGTADVLRPGDNEAVPAELENLSEYGCLLAAKCPLTPGMDVKLWLKIGSYKVAVKGRVRHAEPGSKSGVEFKEIRKGDRQVLQYLLRKLAAAPQTDRAMSAVTQ
jgi:hypothetical protein